MNPHRIVIVGGGAAGFFAAIHCAGQRPDAEVALSLKKPRTSCPKSKISGGGRCNVTHACFDARELTIRYPRGERALIAPFKQFQAADTVEWFAGHGVKLKTEGDGRMFPVWIHRKTIIDCLLNAARNAGVKLRNQLWRGRCYQKSPTALALALSNGEKMMCDKLLLAIGGCPYPGARAIGSFPMGHTLEAPVPSLFTFHIEVPVAARAGGCIRRNGGGIGARDPTGRERGPAAGDALGLSGPAILRLSAWGARELHGLNYHFPLHVNWLPQLNEDALAAELKTRRAAQPAKTIVNSPIAPLPARLWEQLVLFGCGHPARLAPVLAFRFRASPADPTIALLGIFPSRAKSLNKGDEFVTCGGVRLAEVNFTKRWRTSFVPASFLRGNCWTSTALPADSISNRHGPPAGWRAGRWPLRQGGRTSR